MGARLAFGVLGPLEVRLDGAAVRVGGPRQRALLGLLLCHANRVVSRDQLIEELLGDQPAATADRMLRVQVSRLRKALGDGNGQPRLQARPPGYLLRVEDGELDLHAFEQRMSGRAAGARGRRSGPGRGAAPGSGVAVARPSAGRPGVRVVRPAGGAAARGAPHAGRRGPDRRRTRARPARRRRVVCPELEQLVTEHPLRERLRGQLMVALYRCGRQADALETYRAGRSLLVEELAVEPGPELRKLQLAVLEQDTALDLPPSAARRTAATARSPRTSRCPRDVPADQAAPGLTPGGAAPRDSPRSPARRIAPALGQPPRWPRSSSCRCPVTERRPRR